MALEIRFNRGRTFENEAFRRIAKILSKYFEDKKIDGLLIGNAFVESNEFLRPDILLYSSLGTIIIDLKDGNGNLILPPQKDFETIPWTLSGRIVKSGSDRNINPYVQLKRIANRYLKSLQELKFKHPSVISAVLPATRETPDFLYYSTMVLFSGKIKFDTSALIPYPINRWFFLADESNLLNKIEDISNNGKYTPELGNIIKSMFKADPYKIENSNETEDYQPLLNIDYSESQKDCLEKVKTFLSQTENRVLILKGKEKAGKTFLIPEISKLALQNNCAQIETLTVTKRIAAKLNRRQSEVTFSSIYSLIYGGSPISEIEEKEEEEIKKPVGEIEVEVVDEPEKEDDFLETDVIPLRKGKNDIDDSALFIVDEAQLLNSSLFQSENIRFGSGKLLDDFLKFIDLSSTNRKIILIGDPYQLSYGKYETSAIFSKHIESLISQAPTILTLVSDKESESLIEENIDFISNRIAENKFSLLKLFRGDSVKEILTESDRLEIIKKYYSEKKEIKVLCYKNETAFRINEDIRTKIFGRQGDLCVGDFLVLDNNIRIISNDPHETPIFLNNGSTLEVMQIDETQILEPIVLPDKKTKISLSTRRLKVREQGKDKINSILVLENYRLNPKGKVSSEEFVALKIFQGRIIKAKSKSIGFESSNYYKILIADQKYLSLQKEIEILATQVNSGENKKTELKQAKAKLKRLINIFEKAFQFEIRRELMVSNELFNLAFVRYAYALIVHKSLGEYYPNVIFDVNMEKGKNNRDYFQWLYTGITRAQEKLYVINFQEIHPMQNVKYGEMNNTCIANQEPGRATTINYEIESSPEEFRKQYSDYGLTELILNNAFTIIKWLENQGVKAVMEYNPASRYLIKIKSNTETIIFNFSGTGIPGLPRVEKGSNELKLKLLSWVSPKDDDTMLRFPQDWRNDIYTKWDHALSKLGYTWKYFETHGYRDRIWLSTQNSFMTMDVDYNGESFITGIKPLKTNDPNSWDIIKDTISKIDYLS